jgi:hypothetical protein
VQSATDGESEALRPVCAPRLASRGGLVKGAVSAPGAVCEG